MTEEIKRKGNLLPSSADTETPLSFIHTCYQTTLLVVCPKSTWLHSHRNPFYIYSKPQSQYYLYIKAFFFSSQTTIICFKGKSSFQHLFCYSEDALGYETGKDRHTKEGPLRECDETHSWDAVINKVLLYFLLHFFSGKSTLTETTNPKGLTFNCNVIFH